MSMQNKRQPASSEIWIDRRCIVSSPSALRQHASADKRAMVVRGREKDRQPIKVTKV